MGRRKIEIQPIVHERNRSVTFLKRKNGLLKKAYELGVLCSVDIAVIIFEDKLGHEPKLYQYCSTDIKDIVQRHVAFTGEKDTRGPSDFSGNASNKLDDAGEGDDDDQDDETYSEIPVRAGTKRRSNGKPKTAPTNGRNSNVHSPPPQSRPVAIPPLPMPIPGLPNYLTLDRHAGPPGHSLPPPSTSDNFPSSSDDPPFLAGRFYPSPNGPPHLPPPRPTDGSFQSSRGPPVDSAYSRMVYNSPQGHHQQPPQQTRPGDLLSVLLDADEYGRQVQAMSSNFVWPQHGNGSAGNMGSNGSPNSDNNWLGLLSSDASNNNPGGGGGLGREMMSWERGGGGDRRDSFPPARGEAVRSSPRRTESRASAKSSDQDGKVPYPHGGRSHSSNEDDDKKAGSVEK